MYLRGWAGWGGGFARYGYLPARLSKQFYPGAFLPLRAMCDNLVIQHPGPPDALVCGPHQSYGNISLNVSTCPGVGMLPLCCEAVVYPFQGRRRLQNQYPINGGDERQKMSMLLEA